MKSSKTYKMDLLTLCDIAIEAAHSAGKLIQTHIGKEVQVNKKIGGSSYAAQVVTEVDKACEAIILSLLLPTCTRYQIALLSEETEDDLSRFEKDYFWCIDPLDGTLPFINNRPGFSVSISLVAKDGTPHIGVIFDPSANKLYHAIKGQGAFINQTPWSIKNTNQYLTYVTDRKLENTPKLSFIKNLLEEQVKELKLNGIKEIYGGGAVLNAMYVLENGPACMLKLPKNEKGGGSLWDFAASTCIFNELDLKATDFHGQPLDLNKHDDTFMNSKGVFYSNFTSTNSLTLT